MSKRTVSGITLALLLIGMLSLAFNIQPVKAIGTIYIRADGSIDPSSAPIQRVGDTYTLTGNIYDSIVIEKDNIVVDGKGYTVKGTGSGIGTHLYDRYNVTLKNLKVSQFTYGILLEYSDFNLLCNNEASANRAVGMCLDYSHDNVISTNIASNNEETGIDLTNSCNNNISYNEASNNGAAGIILADGSNNNTVYANESFRDKCDQEWDGIRLGYSSDNNVLNNVVWGKRAPPPYGGWTGPSGEWELYYSHGITLVGSQRNNISANFLPVGNHGLRLKDSSSNDISDNNIYECDRGIWLIGSDNNNFSNNYVSQCDWGIWLDESTENVIAYTYVGLCGNGIQLDDSSNNLVADNTVFNISTGIALNGFVFNNTIFNNSLRLSYFGIWLEGRYNTVTGNLIEDGGHGIVVIAEDNRLCGNIIRNNKVVGINLADYSQRNIVSGNNITYNHHGIEVFSSNNTIYHNNFLYNDLQVYSSYGSLNVWDDGYPSAGNYWSDYTGVDLLSGPYQSELGSDGIGDAPYVIDANNRDRYPLMNPWTPIETNVIVKGEDYPVTIVSNTTIDQIVATMNTLHFRSSGPTGEIGYINVIFPMVNTTEIKVFIDGVKLAPPPFPVINTNGTHCFIYFEFALSAHAIAIQFAPLEYILTIHSSPSGVVFTVDSISHTTPWSGTYDEGVSVALVMPETHTIGEARYYWDRWSDGVTSRSRTLTINTDITLTAYFSGPYYQLTVTSSPITGIPFTVNTVSRTTPYAEWLPEGSYTLVMPETYNGYNWSHWLEDGDINRIKTIALPGTIWTGVYKLKAPPVPVGGLWVPINKFELLAPWIAVASLITAAAVSGIYIKHRKKQQN